MQESIQELRGGGGINRFMYQATLARYSYFVWFFMR